MDSAVARILDANANRAREAARVIEEHARFVRDDQPLAAQIKRFRHELAAALSRFDHCDLLAGRNTSGDVGAVLTTSSEMTRPTPQAVVHAASARLSEALRVLEEYGKIVDSEFAHRIKQLRYTAYSLEKDVAFRLNARQRWSSVRLYVLLTEALCVRSWRETAEAVLEGGADALQLREKGWSDAWLLARARALAELCRQHGALLIVNDRPDIARLSQADGVHVGQDDLDVASVRRVAGDWAIVGKSTHTVAQARAAVADQPDYLAVGPMFQSTTKPQDHVAGPLMLRDVAAESKVPLVAIGGITLEQASEVVAAGANAICVCSAIISAADPAAATAAFKQAVSNMNR